MPKLLPHLWCCPWLRGRLAPDGPWPFCHPIGPQLPQPEGWESANKEKPKRKESVFASAQLPSLPSLTHPPRTYALCIFTHILYIFCVVSASEECTDLLLHPISHRLFQKRDFPNRCYMKHAQDEKQRGRWASPDSVDSNARVAAPPHSLEE